MEAVLSYVAKELPTIDPARSSLQSVVGRYEWSFERALEITLEGSRGRAVVTDYFQTSLYPLSATKFLTDIPHLEFQLVKREQDLAMDIVCKTRGYQKKLRRLPHSVRTPFELFQAGEYDLAVATYRAFHRQHSDSYLVSESRLNSLGYKFLRNGRVKEARAVFQLNTQLYPNSSNAFDSLADALEVIGDIPAAIDHYRKATELDSSNTHAREKLSKLSPQMP
jgi:tetratricopeptide (TPR) repeat protein